MELLIANGLIIATFYFCIYLLMQGHSALTARFQRLSHWLLICHCLVFIFWFTGHYSIVQTLTVSIINYTMGCIYSLVIIYKK